MAMSTFRRSLKAETKRSGGKGSKGAWREKWRLPQSGPTPIVMITADYVDHSPPAEQVEIDPVTGRPKEVRTAFFKARKHKRKIMKNGNDWYSDEICSAGNDPHNPQPCVGCFAMDSGDKSVSSNDIFCFGLVHLALYHAHPVLDDKNQIMMRRDNSGHVENFDECSGRNCNYCRTLAGAPLMQDPKWPNWQPQHIRPIFGQRRYFEIGKGHLSNLESWDTAVSACCQQCRRTLTTDGFKCPTCHNRVIDMTTDPRTDEQIQEAVSVPYPCMACNRPVLLTEEVSCDTCTSQGRQGSPFPLFGSVLHALREGENMKSQMVLRTFQHIEEFEREEIGKQLMFGATVGQLMNGKTMRQLVEELAQPYDFPELMKPRGLPEQSKRLELPIPPTAQGQGYQPQTQSYQPPGNQGYGAQRQPQQQGGALPYGAPQNQQQPTYGGAAASPQVQAQTWQAGPGHTGNTAPQPVQQAWQPPQPVQQNQQAVSPQFVQQPGQPQQSFVPPPVQQQQAPGPVPFVPPARQNFGNG